MSDAQASAIGLVVFDLAGTIVDFGCFAPVMPFVEVYAERGVEVSVEQARVPMGLEKRDHLQRLAEIPDVAERWKQRHGRPFSITDLDELYAAFIPRQLATIGAHAAAVPGLHETIAKLRQAGCKLATGTGYFREAAQQVWKALDDQEIARDVDLCAEDVPEGRPAPWMTFRAMERTGVYPASRVLKVGDTVPDIQEGLNAGAWSVGVTSSSSLVGLTPEDFDRSAAEERAERLGRAREKFLAAGAHAVVDTIAELPALVDRIAAGGSAVPVVLDGAAIGAG